MHYMVIALALQSHDPGITWSAYLEHVLNPPGVQDWAEVEPSLLRQLGMPSTLGKESGASAGASPAGHAAVRKVPTNGELRCQDALLIHYRTVNAELYTIPPACPLSIHSMYDMVRWHMPPSPYAWPGGCSSALSVGCLHSLSCCQDRSCKHSGQVNAHMTRSLHDPSCPGTGPCRTNSGWWEGCITQHLLPLHSRCCRRCWCC